jgi:hypothetical protein
VLEEPLDALGLSCYNKSYVVLEKIYEFIHDGRHTWDVIGHDEDPIYDIEGHFQLLPLQKTYVIAIDFDVWQQGDDMITNFFQPPRDDLLQHYHGFHSYPRGFDTHSFEHLDLFYEDHFQPPLFSNFDEGAVMICPKRDFCDETFQPPPFPSSRCVTKDAVGKHVPCPKLSPRKTNSLEFKGRLDVLRRNLTSHILGLPLSNYQASSKFLFIPSQALGSDEVRDSHPSGSLS